MAMLVTSPSSNEKGSQSYLLRVCLNYMGRYLSTYKSPFALLTLVAIGSPTKYVQNLKNLEKMEMLNGFENIFSRKVHIL